MDTEPHGTEPGGTEKYRTGSRLTGGYGADGHGAGEYGTGEYGDDPGGSAGPDGGPDEPGGGSGRGPGRGRGRGRRRGGADGGRRERAEAPASPPRDPEEAARALALRLLTGTPRTRRQLADAMERAGIPGEAAERVLARFEEVGLIDDGAFANAWVESRHHGRGLARRALARELRTRGVDDTLVDEAVGRLDREQEEATARELVQRRLRATRGLDRDRRIRRLAGMLARKGYPEGVALRVVRRALEEEGEDPEVLERYLPE
ncbi:hypothetical protein GCM10027168_55000 [Streptomyces capparidis]